MNGGTRALLGGRGRKTGFAGVPGGGGGTRGGGERRRLIRREEISEEGKGIVLCGAKRSRNLSAACAPADGILLSTAGSLCGGGAGALSHEKRRRFVNCGAALLEDLVRQRRVASARRSIRRRTRNISQYACAGVFLVFLPSRDPPRSRHKKPAFPLSTRRTVEAANNRPRREKILKFLDNRSLSPLNAGRNLSDCSANGNPRRGGAGNVMRAAIRPYNRPRAIYFLTYSEFFLFRYCSRKDSRVPLKPPECHLRGRLFRRLFFV